MRIAAGVEYNGSEFHGWQRQINSLSVQQIVEQAISTVANHSVEVSCAGRTDAGVHAQGQVIHFDTEALREPRQWQLGINSNLASNVSITWVKIVSDEFHARYAATARRYRYIIFNRFARPAMLVDKVCWVYHPLNEEAMQAAAKHLLGKHDFTAYRAVACQSKSAIRTIESIQVERSGEFLYIDIQANAFLQHMVRNIVGVLTTIGQGLKSTEWSREVLQVRDRTQGGITAPASGLYLVGVRYPQKFGITDIPVPMRFAQ